MAAGGGDGSLLLYRILHKIAKELDKKDELEEVKFLCSGLIKRSALARIDSHLKLFTELTKIGKVAEDDFSFVEDLLRTVGREDLLTQLRTQLNERLTLEGEWQLEFSEEKRENERLKEQIARASSEISRLSEMVAIKEQTLQQATTTNEGLKTALRREREASSSAVGLCRRLEEENIYLKSQAETDKMENDRLKGQAETYTMENDRLKGQAETYKIEYERLKDQADAKKRENERLKEQIASMSNSLYEMSQNLRGVADRDGTNLKEDTDVGRHFHFIKENVTTEWKDLAVKLGLSWADVTNIEGRNRDDKSRCWDALQEWRKLKGEAATTAVLMEALRELEMTSVVDGLKSKFQGF